MTSDTTEYTNSLLIEERTKITADNINPGMELVEHDNPLVREVTMEASRERAKENPSEGQSVTQRCITRVEDEPRGLIKTVKQLVDMIKGNFPITQGEYTTTATRIAWYQGINVLYQKQSRKSRAIATPTRFQLNTRNSFRSNGTTDPQQKDSDSPMTPSASLVTERQTANNELADIWSKNTQEIVASSERPRPELPAFRGENTVSS